MSDFKLTVRKITSDGKRLGSLLALEKKRRRLEPNLLAFIGMANVAEHWWCTQKAVLRSRVEEKKFFASYLYDRIMCAQRLGLIDELPRRDEALLDAGHELTLADREKLFKEDKGKASEATLESIEVVNMEGKHTEFINPDLSEGERRLLKEQAEARGAVVASPFDLVNPLQRGRYAHYWLPEKYPAFRWSFPWRKYIVVGVPDGLTGQFVYEYKTTHNHYLFSFLKPVAFAQADLYGYFFQRPGKRVQIRIDEGNKTETFDEPTNQARAEETLAAFARVDGGESAFPPKAWKCRSCEFKVTCPISQSK